MERKRVNPLDKLGVKSIRTAVKAGTYFLCTATLLLTACCSCSKEEAVQDKTSRPEPKTSIKVTVEPELEYHYVSCAVEDMVEDEPLELDYTIGYEEVAVDIDQIANYHQAQQDFLQDIL